MLARDDMCPISFVKQIWFHTCFSFPNSLKNCDGSHYYFMSSISWDFWSLFSREMQTLINVSVSLGIYVVVKSLNEEMTIYSIGSLLLAPSMNKAIQFRNKEYRFSNSSWKFLKIARFSQSVGRQGSNIKSFCKTLYCYQMILSLASKTLSTQNSLHFMTNHKTLFIRKDIKINF